jgi:hypothetical protein
LESRGGTLLSGTMSITIHNSSFFISFDPRCYIPSPYSPILDSDFPFFLFIYFFIPQYT